jgi:hypothetical protein
MGQPSTPDVAHIGDALNSIRAAIEVVQEGAADRVIVQVLTCEQILPAARALGRAAGVVVEPSWWPDDEGCDIVIRAERSPE